MATDRETYANMILRGYASPALGGLVPPGVPGHSPDIGLRLDPEEARRLMAEAGYPGGRRFPPTELGFSAPTADFVTFLQAGWRDALGVDVTLRPRAFSELDAMRVSPPPLMVAGWVMDYPDPDNLLRIGIQTWGTKLRLDSAHLQLVEEAGMSTRPEQRMAMYQEADRMLVDQAAVMPLVYSRNHMLLKPWVKRYPSSPVRRDFWKDVVLEPH